MIRLGYLDDEKANRTSFFRLFKKDFEVVMLDDNTKVDTLDMVIDEIDNLNIDVLAVDFRLADKGWVSYNGDEVIRTIWNKRRYFPVFMITSFVNDALQEMDNVFLVNDKDFLTDVSKCDFLKQQIAASVATYHRIITEKNNRQKELIEKQKSGVLNDKEEQEMLRLNVEMYYIDPKSNPISPDMLQTAKVKELHEIVDISRALLKSLKSEDDIQK